MFFPTLLFFAGGYLLLCLVVFLVQEKLVFMPRKGAGDTPAVLGLEFEDIRFANAEGFELHGWYLPAGPQFPVAPVVLFCHGNAGNLTHRLETARLIHALGLGLFLFDYQGYGQSQGSPSEAGTYADVEAAWNFLVRDKGFPSGQIILWGRSLGGAIAAWCADKHRPQALILESTFTSLPDMGAKIYPFLPVRFLCRLRYNTQKRLSSIDCPVLVIHSPADDIVPYAFGRELFAAAGEPKRFLEISGDHNQGFLSSGQRYTAGVREFFQSTGLGPRQQVQP